MPIPQQFIVPSLGTDSVQIDATSFGLTANDVPAVKRGLLVHDAASNFYLSWLQTSPGALIQVIQQDYFWNEIQLDRPSYLTDGSGIPGGGTTATVVIMDPAIFEGQTFAEMTMGQNFIVNSVTNGPSSSTCVVQRTDAGTINATAGVVEVVDTASEMIEGGQFLDPVSYDPAQFQNTVTKASFSIGITTEKSTNPKFWGFAWDLDKLATVTRMKAGMNRNLFLSQLAIDPAYIQNGKAGKRRSTRGTLSSITQNVTAGPPNGVVNFAALLDFAQHQMWPDQFTGNSTKLLLMGQDAAYDLAASVLPQYRTEIQGPQVYGIQLSGFAFPSGQRAIAMVEPAFNQIPGLRRGLVALDVNNIYMTHMDDLYVMKNTTLPNFDTHSMSITSRYGSQVEYDRSHAVMYNFN